MNEMSVSVRELKTRLSEYLRQVKSGQTIVITEHGLPVGRIVPAAQSVESRLQAMIQAGLVAWSGNKLTPMSPVAQARKRSVADLIVEERGGPAIWMPAPWSNVMWPKPARRKWGA